MTKGQGIALVVVALLLLGGGGYLAFRIAANGDHPAPEHQANADDGHVMPRTNGDEYTKLCERADHHAGYTYTRHRYPRTTGGEITAVIHRGFAPMRVPRNTPDAQWIVNPPSEVMY